MSKSVPLPDMFVSLGVVGGTDSLGTDPLGSDTDSLGAGKDTDPSDTTVKVLILDPLGTPDGSESMFE